MFYSFDVTSWLMQQLPAVLRRVPPDCALLAFFGCCLVLCQLSRLAQGPDGP